MTIPSLTGVPALFEIKDERRGATALVRALVAEALVDTDRCAWTGDSIAFLRGAMKQWVDDHAGNASKWFPAFALIIDGPAHWDFEVVETFEEESLSTFYIAVGSDMGEASLILMRDTLELLAGAHPKFPSTFYSLLIRSVSHVVNFYDWWIAEEDRERMVEYYEDMDEAAFAQEFGAISMIPEIVRPKPMGVASLRSVLKRRRRDEVRDLLEAALQVHEAAGRINLPRFEVGWAWDWVAPNPTIVMAMDRGDQVCGYFDRDIDERWEAGMNAAPAWMVQLDTRDSRALRDAVTSFWRACETLAVAADLIERLPGVTRDMPLAQVLGAEGDDRAVAHALTLVTA